jgi:heme/copper-type cytochrome/quinol oxidase subunit 4
MKYNLSKTIAQITAAVSLILIPSSAFATVTLCTLAQQAVGYFNMAVEVILGLAVVVFVYNIFRYFFMDRENNKERGMYLLWSIIGFAVILCFWGLVNLVSNSFNLDKAVPSGFGNIFGGGSGSSGSGSSPCGTPSSSAPNNNTGGMNGDNTFLGGT